MYSAQSDLRDLTTARFGHSHGYRIDGDAALLNAHIDLAERAEDRSFALQLWACDEPYGGGPLSGFKVAEAPVALAGADRAARHDAVAFARPPAAVRDYSMVLVLAAGEQGAFDQVHDFANYPRRERFLVPQLAGAVACERHEDGSLSVQVERVDNPRGVDNLSGSLVLQLWASAEPYRGGALDGALIGSWELGQLRGQETLAPALARRAAAPSAPHLVLALCEWTAQGYLARDYRTFVEPQAAKPTQRDAPAPAAGSTASLAAAPQLPKVSATDQPAKKPAPASSIASEPADTRLSLNGASEAQLVVTLGISAKLAAQLVRARPFKSFDQLRSVRGIGDKTVQKIRKLFTLG